MCKTIDVQKTKRQKKQCTVNKRDVQTGCPGYVHPSGILPFHTVIRFIFRRCDEGGDMCHGAHTREEQGHADEDINSNDNI